MLRTATPADIERLADFNVRVHGDELLRAGTWDGLGGGHPVLTVRHQLIVEDAASGAIVRCSFGFSREALQCRSPPMRRIINFRDGCPMAAH